MPHPMIHFSQAFEIVCYVGVPVANLQVRLQPPTRPSSLGAQPSAEIRHDPDSHAVAVWRIWWMPAAKLRKVFHRPLATRASTLKSHSAPPIIHAHPFASCSHI